VWLYALLFFWLQEASLTTEHGGSTLTTKSSHGRALAAPSKSRKPSLPLSSNIPFYGCQETCFPKAQKGPVHPNVPDHGRAPASLLKTKNARGSGTEGKVEELAKQ
jgi:hypothetical protein